MAGKSKSVKNEKPVKQDYYSKQMRRNQIIFGVIAVLLILVMTLSLFNNF